MYSYRANGEGCGFDILNDEQDIIATVTREEDADNVVQHLEGPHGTYTVGRDHEGDVALIDPDDIEIAIAFGRTNFDALLTYLNR